MDTKGLTAFEREILAYKTVYSLHLPYGWDFKPFCEEMAYRLKVDGMEAWQWWHDAPKTKARDNTISMEEFCKEHNIDTTKQTIRLWCKKNNCGIEEYYKWKKDKDKRKSDVAEKRRLFHIRSANHKKYKANYDKLLKENKKPIRIINVLTNDEYYFDHLLDAINFLNIGKKGFYQAVRNKTSCKDIYIIIYDTKKYSNKSK